MTEFFGRGGSLREGMGQKVGRDTRLADDGKRFDAVDVLCGRGGFYIGGQGVRGRGWGKRLAGKLGWRMTWRIFQEAKSVVNMCKNLANTRRPKVS